MTPHLLLRSWGTLPAQSMFCLVLDGKAMRLWCVYVHHFGLPLHIMLPLQLNSVETSVCGTVWKLYVIYKVLYTTVYLQWQNRVSYWFQLSWWRLGLPNMASQERSLKKRKKQRGLSWKKRETEVVQVWRRKRQFITPKWTGSWLKPQPHVQQPQFWISVLHLEWDRLRFRSRFRSLISSTKKSIFLCFQHMQPDSIFKSYCPCMIKTGF